MKHISLKILLVPLTVYLFFSIYLHANLLMNPPVSIEECVSLEVLEAYLLEYPQDQQRILFNWIEREK